MRYSPYGVPTSYPAGDANRNGETNGTDFTDMTTVLSGGSAAVVCHIDLNKDGLYPDTADTDFLNDESVLTAKKGGLNKVGTGSAGPSLRMAYAGYAWDPAIKAYHVRHRVYNAEMGRWLTRDPMEYADSMNLVSYAMNAPVIQTDSTGTLVYTCCKQSTPDPGDECTKCALSCYQHPERLGETPRGIEGGCCICDINLNAYIRTITILHGGDPNRVDPTARGIIETCVAEHERCHESQPYGGTLTSDCYEPQCYGQEISCLQLRKSNCTNKLCRDLIDEKIEDSWCGIKKNCGSCGAGNVWQSNCVIPRGHAKECG